MQLPFDLPLDPTVSDIVAMSAAGVALLSLLVAVVAVARVGRLRRALGAAATEPAARTDVTPIDVTDVGALRGQLAAAERRIGALTADVAGALRHVAVVRYDAFQDMGGRMSFSAALLDDAGDGIVLTAINGRSETRAYAKGVSDGASENTLSPEEQQAIDAALGQKRARQGAPVPSRRAG